jgi:hypothetical protein
MIAKIDQPDLAARPADRRLVPRRHIFASSETSSFAESG